MKKIKKSTNLFLVLFFSCVFLQPSTVFGQLSEPAKIIEVNDVRNTLNSTLLVEDLDVKFNTQYIGNNYEYRIFIVKSTVDNFDADDAILLSSSRYNSIENLTNNTITVNLSYMFDTDGDEVSASYNEIISATPNYKIFILTIESGTNNKILSNPSNVFQIEFITTVTPSDNIQSIFYDYKMIYQTLRIYAQSGIYIENIDFYQGVIGKHTKLYFISLNGAKNTIIKSAQNNKPVINIGTCNSTGMDIGVIKGFTITNANNSVGSGGIACNVSGNLFLENLIIKNNTALYGGGIGFIIDKTDYITETVYISNTLIFDNYADIAGGVQIPTNNAHIDNVTIVNNNAHQGGGIVYSSSNGVANINNSIIFNNNCDDPYYSDYQIYMNNNETMDINNCFIENGINGIYGQYTYSNIIEGTETYTPEFIDPNNEDFHLNYELNSPCINVGANNLVPDDLLYDLDGNDRILFNTVDLGCYENTGLNPQLYNFTIDDGIECEGTEIGYYLSGSNYGLPYTLVRNYGGGNQQQVYNTILGNGSPISWTELNEPGIYNAFAYWNIPSLRTMMNGTQEVFADPLPPTSVVLDLTTVSGNEIIDGDYLVQNNIEVLSGGILLVENSVLYFSPGTKLIVKPGGKLIINGSTLTNSCGDLWQGITVLGNSNLDQQTDNNQGVLEVRNGAVIENAINAIYVGNPNNPGDNNGGGIIRIDNATFRNNRTAVAMPKYQNFAFNDTNIHINNVSYIKNSTFETTDGFYQMDNTYPYAFISLWQVDGVQILNNNFKNISSSINLFKGRGIIAQSASFSSIDNNFENLYHAIKGTNSSSTYCRTSTFKNNYYDAIFTDTTNTNNNINFSKCSFEINDDFFTTIASSKHEYVSLSYMDNAVFKGNTFTFSGSSSTPYYNRGVGITASFSSVNIEPYISTTSDTINNIFNSLEKAVVLAGDGVANNVFVNKTTFNNNQTAMLISSVATPVVTRNIFTVPSITDVATKGLFLDNCTGYQIEENSFSSTNKQLNYGLIVRNSGIEANEIYKNTFNNLFTACQAQGNNGQQGTIHNGGLQFICNNFTDNKFNVFVTEYTPSSNQVVQYSAETFQAPLTYGISQYQGSQKLSAGNNFLGTFDYDISNYQAPFTYFYDLEINSLPRKVTEQTVFTSLLFTEGAVNQCPTHIDDNPPPPSEIIALQDSIQSTQQKLSQTSDAGNTEDILYQIQTANPGQANKLERILLQISPYLSDTSMVSSTQIDAVLPPVMLANILGANPRAAKSSAVLNALAKRTHPLPPPFMDQILLGRDTVSHLEVIAANLGMFMSHKNRMLNQIAFDLRTDTLNTNAADSLIQLLSNDNTLYSDYMLISYYLYLLEVDNAQNLLNDIPNKYDLTSFEQREHQKMVDLTNIQANLITQNKFYRDLSEDQRAILYTLSEDTILRSGAFARNIISFTDSVKLTYGVVIPIIDTTNVKATQPLPKLEFTVSPNPAEDYFVVDYQLPTIDVQNSLFVMYGADNQIVHKQAIDMYWYQLLVETDNVVPGFYVCKLYQNGVELSAQPIIIKQDEMSALQLSQAQQAQQNFNNSIKTLKIYPNPAADFITVEYYVTADATIRISDNSGKILETTYVLKGNSSVNISVIGFSSGLYNVDLIINGKTTDSIQFIKK